MNRLLSLLIVAALMTATLGHQSDCYADETADVHFAAHFGMSYAINTISFGIAKEAFHMNPTQAYIFSAGLTLMAGFVYKFMELQPGDTGSSIPRAMLENAAGCAAFGLTVMAFKF